MTKRPYPSAGSPPGLALPTKKARPSSSGRGVQHRRAGSPLASSPPAFPPPPASGATSPKERRSRSRSLSAAPTPADSGAPTPVPVGKKKRKAKEKGKDKKKEAKEEDADDETVPAGEGTAMVAVEGEDGEGDPDAEGEDEDVEFSEDEFGKNQQENTRQKEDIRVLMDNFDEDQRERHEAYRRAALNKAGVRRLVNQALQQSVGNTILTVVRGVSKVFVGEITEKARSIAGHEGPLTPADISEAYRLYQLEHRQAGQGGGRKKKMFTR